MLLVRRLGGAATSQFRDGKSGGKSATSAAEQLPKRPPTPQSLWPSIEAPQSPSSAKIAVVSLILVAAAPDFPNFPTSGVAQWLACWAHNPKVRGSKPRSANAKKRLVGKLAGLGSLRLLVRFLLGACPLGRRPAAPTKIAQWFCARPFGHKVLGSIPPGSWSAVPPLSGLRACLGCPCCPSCILPRQRGGIELLYVSIPLELKSSPSTSPTHPGLWMLRGVQDVPMHDREKVSHTHSPCQKPRGKQGVESLCPRVSSCFYQLYRNVSLAPAMVWEGDHVGHLRCGQ